MSHTKAGGSTKNGRDSSGKRLGVKLFGGQHATAGDIIVRQRGETYVAGENTFLASDYTVHAAVEGKVAYKQINKRRFTGAPLRKTVVTIDTSAE